MGEIRVRSQNGSFLFSHNLENGCGSFGIRIVLAMKDDSSPGNDFKVQIKGPNTCETGFLNVDVNANNELNEQ